MRCLRSLVQGVRGQYSECSGFRVSRDLNPRRYLQRNPFGPRLTRYLGTKPHKNPELRLQGLQCSGGRVKDTRKKNLKCFCLITKILQNHGIYHTCKTGATTACLSLKADLRSPTRWHSLVSATQGCARPCKPLVLRRSLHPPLTHTPLSGVSL